MIGKTAAIVKTKPRGLARVTGGSTAAVRAVGLLGGMLTYAKEMGYVEQNPLTASASPPTSADHSDLRRRTIAPSGRLSRPLRQGEHWQAIAAIRLIALTGCRRSEILNLKWSEVDFKGSCLRLGDTKTGASLRPLPSPPTRSWRISNAMATTSFRASPAADRSYASVFPKAWRRIVGTDYSPHGLRHAYASAAHELGLGELTIKALLGHARIGVTSGYIATVDSFLLASAENIASYVEAAMNGERGEVVLLANQRTSRLANVL